MGFELIMKIVKNKISDFILWKGYSAITIWPFIFIRTDTNISETLINHEKIHGRQQLEMALIGFYLWYVIEWVIRLFVNGPKFAYRNICFEREVFDNESNIAYLEKRQWFAWRKYLKR